MDGVLFLIISIMSDYNSLLKGLINLIYHDGALFMTLKYVTNVPSISEFGTCTGRSTLRLIGTIHV